LRKRSPVGSGPASGELVQQSAFALDSQDGATWSNLKPVRSSNWWVSNPPVSRRAFIMNSKGIRPTAPFAPPSAPRLVAARLARVGGPHDRRRAGIRELAVGSGTDSEIVTKPSN